MSKFPSGIFSKARGKLSGVVFSAARTRKGKLMTARQLVIPANPQTQSQQSNRGIFSYSQAQVRSLGSGVYRDDWNRAVEDLPGYQSLLSLVRRSYNISTPPDEWRASSPNPAQELGELHFPNTVTFNLNLGTPALEVDWSTENGDNGSAGDTAKLLVFQAEVDAADDSDWISSYDEVDRSVGEMEISINFDGYQFGTYAVLYFVNYQNEVPNQRSNTQWSYDLVV